VTPPRLLLILTENWTMRPPPDVGDLVAFAVEAERAGIDGVMVSEHIVLGPSANAAGLPANPRDYALPGNQDPATPWPSSVVLLSAIAAATERIRLVAGAILAPLRHPLLLARELGTLDVISGGRLVVQPTVSWSRDEYAALGVPFARRGAILDEQLEIMRLLWQRSPASYHGEFFRFTDVYLEPKAHRPDGPRLWFGGQRVSPPILARLVRYGHGFHPLGSPAEQDLTVLREGMAAAGRPMAELEMIGGVRAVFTGSDSCADLGQAMSAIPEQLAAGFTTFCVKPSQFIDDPAQVGSFCRDVIRRAEAIGGAPG
jgi:probable F420-dependent oxidoreductase